MSEEWMALQRFNNGDDAIVATDAEVVTLSDVMGQDNPGALANTRKNGEKDSPL
jgi:hypothetical protein